MLKRLHSACHSETLIKACAATLFGFCASFSALADTPSAELPPSTTFRCDVVVVGAGSAGLTAAVAASEAGARVIVLEKMPVIGGNSLLSAGFLVATEPADTKDFNTVRDTMMTVGGQKADRALITRMLQESGATVKWLENHGARLSRQTIELRNSPPVHPYVPTGRTAIGEEIIQTLLSAAESRRIPVQGLSDVRSLVRDNTGRVIGVRVTDRFGRQRYVYSSAVVLATGGFGANAPMVKEYSGIPETTPNTNMPGSTGDGILMAEAVGARTTDMDAVVVHPTTMPFTGFLIPMQTRLHGAVLVDTNGRRFADELSYDLDKAIARLPEKRAWIILDRKLVKALPVLENYARSGYFIRASSDAELARKLRISPDVLCEELEHYRASAAAGRDDEFGRKRMESALDDYPLFALSVQPAVHSTLGGLAVDNDARVLGKEAPIPGLYAAGEVTGGIFGQKRIDGAGLTNTLVFGRIAGQAAAKFALEHQVEHTAP